MARINRCQQRPALPQYVIEPRTSRFRSEDGSRHKCSTDLLNSRFAYVSISRARQTGDSYMLSSTQNWKRSERRRISFNLTRSVRAMVDLAFLMTKRAKIVWQSRRPKWPRLLRMLRIRCLPFARSKSAIHLPLSFIPITLRQVLPFEHRLMAQNSAHRRTGRTPRWVTQVRRTGSLRTGN
jgi:hypothetical protein